MKKKKKGRTKITEHTMSRAYRRILERKKRKQKRKRIVMAMLSLVIIFVSFLLFVPEAKLDPASKNDSERGDVSFVSPTSSFVKPLVSTSYVELKEDELKCPTAVILDIENNEFLAGKNKDQIIYPASMTKVMTLIVAVEKLESTDQVWLMTEEMYNLRFTNDASCAGFLPGEWITANDLLYGLILPSGADAAWALAEMVAGSEEEFVKLMNEKCEELGLENTHFENTSGLHGENHYSTVREMAIIMEYAMKDELCSQILSTHEYVTSQTTMHPEGIHLTSTLFRRIYGDEREGLLVQAGKTGFTNQAKQCLVECILKNDKRYIVVTAGGISKWDTVGDGFLLCEKYAP